MEEMEREFELNEQTINSDNNWNNNSYDNANFTLEERDYEEMQKKAKEAADYKDLYDAEIKAMQNKGLFNKLKLSILNFFKKIKDFIKEHNIFASSYNDKQYSILDGINTLPNKNDIDYKNAVDRVIKECNELSATEKAELPSDVKDNIVKLEYTKKIIELSNHLTDPSITPMALQKIMDDINRKMGYGNIDSKFLPDDVINKINEAKKTITSPDKPQKEQSPSLKFSEKAVFNDVFKQALSLTNAENIFLNSKKSTDNKAVITVKDIDNNGKERFSNIIIDKKTNVIENKDVIKRIGEKTARIAVTGWIKADAIINSTSNPHGYDMSQNFIDAKFSEIKKMIESNKEKEPYFVNNSMVSIRKDKNNDVITLSISKLINSHDKIILNEKEKNLLSLNVEINNERENQNGIYAFTKDDIETGKFENAMRYLINKSSSELIIDFDKQVEPQLVANIIKEKMCSDVEIKKMDNDVSQITYDSNKTLTMKYNPYEENNLNFVSNNISQIEQNVLTDICYLAKLKTNCIQDSEILQSVENKLNNDINNYNHEKQNNDINNRLEGNIDNLENQTNEVIDKNETNDSLDNPDLNDNDIAEI